MDRVQACDTRRFRAASTRTRPLHFSPRDVIVARLRPGSARTKKAPPCATLVAVPSGSISTAAPAPMGWHSASTTLTKAAAVRRMPRVTTTPLRNGGTAVSRSRTISTSGGKRVYVDAHLVRHVRRHAGKHQPALRVGRPRRLVVEQDRSVGHIRHTDQCKAVGDLARDERLVLDQGHAARHAKARRCRRAGLTDHFRGHGGGRQIHGRSAIKTRSFGEVSSQGAVAPTLVEWQRALHADELPRRSNRSPRPRLRWFVGRATSTTPRSRVA